MSEKLLVVAMPGRMGDIIACEPLFRKLHELHPERKMYFYTKESYASLMRKAPYIDKIVPFKDYMEFDCQKAQFPPDTLCVELNFHREHSSDTEKDQPAEFVPLLQSFAQSAHVEVPDEPPRFYVDETAFCPPLPDRYLVFHCRSDGRSRQWSGRYWNMLAAKAFNKGIHVVEIGETRTIHVNSHHYIALTGKIDLQTAAKVIRSCSGFVGVESGFGHLANALGRFGFIITGKLRAYPEYVTYSGDFGHYGSRSNLLRFYDVPSDQLPFPVVSTAFERLLDGKPFSFEECRTFCLTEQIKLMRCNLLFRLQESLLAPFAKLKRAIRHHRRHHHSKKHSS